jgi:hypothetical protein
MPYRTFIDEAGATWQVWEVRPARVERRMRERRLAQVPFGGPERRRGTDRRLRAEQRIFLGEELAQGWLAFHAGIEKRRYAPIPDGWQGMTQKELSRVCKEAVLVQPGGPTFGPRGGGGSGGTGERRVENRDGGERARPNGQISADQQRPRSA